ncbi:MAG: TPM domain-containing protein [Pseudomonas sp.]|uniref:TPM domain-containing protein n=1 Tax=Halopseudomonas laoshanensis TaxID=2268758 RepID=UPI001B779A05|nr:TPM domain-containing protein [Pseudomonas sp.]MBQ0777809.1 TPM domain-containing protein [Pseudomonas sp.]
MSYASPLSVIRSGIKAALIAGLVLMAGTVTAQELTVPELTGRVVDQAEMLESATESQLTSMLASHEQATGEQVVVVTVPDLQGRSIEEFGLELGRTWGIGQAEEDTGALLIIARDDRLIRIEVGYGLEGRLTDAQSSVIINSIITPAFRQNEFERGIVEGTAAMIQVLGGDPLRTPEPPPVSKGDKPPVGIFILLFFIVMGLIGGGGRGGRGKRGRLGTAMLAGALLGGMGGRGGGMGGGGGFGGGGGGFGGGGASGGW